jgi:hypothetical protein
MSNLIKEETDFKIAERGCLRIQNGINTLKKNIDFILKNKDLLTHDKIHAPIGYISIGCQALETILGEIRNHRE